MVDPNAIEDIGGLLQHNVTFSIEIDGHPEPIQVREVSITEGMNSLPTCTVRATGSGPPPVARDLLRRSCKVSIVGPGQQRSFHGIVWQCRVLEGDPFHTIVFRIAAAAQLLDHVVDTYMYQDKSVPEIVKAIVERYLGPLQRHVNIDRLQTRYVDREYTLQYQETCFAFIARLCEEEGIYFFFDHDAPGESSELLVLADHASSLPKARAHDGGSVAYNDSGQVPPGEEAVTHIEHAEEVGATDMVVAGYDWTNTTLRIRKENTGRGPNNPALEIYDHASVDLYDYQQPQYRGNTASAQADVRAELLDVSRQYWQLESTVITAQAGYLLRVTGAPRTELDAEYLIVTASSSGHVVAGEGGIWHASLEAVPTSIPYRPARRTPRPVVPGPETAFVVGPSGDDIHTDEHGRVKVQFHWDRQHQRNAESSCWLRVAHNWAGGGFGTFFLPRIGMEVVVSFLGGNPDRPLVTGCVYNGTNHHPDMTLPQDKTQSVIRTKSSGAGASSTGYNELRFEDKAGHELINVHAERDLHETVKRNRTTRIHHDDQLTVTHDSSIEVHGEEFHKVFRRARWIYPDRAVYSYTHRTTGIGLDDEGTASPGDYYCNAAERAMFFGDAGRSPAWKDHCNQEGRKTHFKFQTRWEVKLDNGYYVLKCATDPATMLKYDAQDGYIDLGGRSRVMMSAGSSPSALSGVKAEPDKLQLRSAGEIKADITNGQASITMNAGSIRLAVGGTEMVLHAAGINITAPIFMQTGTTTIMTPSASAAVLSGTVTRGGKPTWD